jgi:hypothetical protein
MMNVITLKDPKIMGDKHDIYGYTFWSLTDTDFPVMFNHKEGNIMPGTRITYESSEPKVSKNGTDYLRLKKVSLEDSPEPQKMPFSEKPAPTFTDKAYLRDASTIPLDVWRTLIGIQGVPNSPDEFSLFFETVMDHANELLALIDKVRTGSQPSATHAEPIKVDSLPAGDIKQKLERGFSSEPFEEDN